MSNQRELLKIRIIKRYDTEHDWMELCIQIREDGEWKDYSVSSSFPDQFFKMPRKLIESDLYKSIIISSVSNSLQDIDLINKNTIELKKDLKAKELEKKKKK